MDENEIWKPVVGYEGAYEVSSLGRVRSLERRSPVKLASGVVASRYIPPRMLRPAPNSCGYLSVSLAGKNSAAVHHLVLRAFHGDRPESLHGLHINGDKTDNRASNLRYGTRSENMIDMFAHGQRKLTRDQVLRIRAAKLRGLERGEKKRLAEEMGISLSTVRDVLQGRSYAYVA